MKLVVWLKLLMTVSAAKKECIVIYVQLFQLFLWFFHSLIILIITFLETWDVDILHFLLISLLIESVLSFLIHLLFIFLLSVWLSIIYSEIVRLSTLKKVLVFCIWVQSLINISEQFSISACYHEWLSDFSQLWYNHSLTLCSIRISSVLICWITVISSSIRPIIELKKEVIERITITRKWEMIVSLKLRWRIKMLLTLLSVLLTVSLIICEYTMTRPLIFDVHIKPDILLIIDVFN